MKKGERASAEARARMSAAHKGVKLSREHAQNIGKANVVPVVERFWPKVVQGDGCWEWQGAKTPKGYGVLRMEGKLVYAHRVCWILTHGDPGQLHVLHECDNPCCVRPDHLFLGTRSDNMQDMASKGRWGNQTRRGVAHA